MLILEHRSSFFNLRHFLTSNCAFGEPSMLILFCRWLHLTGIKQGNGIIYVILLWFGDFLFNLCTFWYILLLFWLFDTLLLLLWNNCCLFFILLFHDRFRCVFVCFDLASFIWHRSMGMGMGMWWVTKTEIYLTFVVNVFIILFVIVLIITFITIIITTHFLKCNFTLFFTNANLIAYFDTRLIIMQFLFYFLTR